MTQRFGCQTMHETLRVVMVRPPDGAFGQADPSRWHYTSRPDLNAAPSSLSSTATLEGASATSRTRRGTR